MVDLLSAWIKEIILVVLFATFVEFLLPTSSMQRFVRVIMGLFIMLAILNPILSVVDNSWRLTQVPALSTRSVGAVDIQRQANDAFGDRNRLAGEIYRRDIAKQIRALVTAIEGVADAQVTVDLQGQQDGKYTGAIQKVTVHVKPGAEGTDKIPKVTIGDKKSADELPPVVADKIRRTVAELYQLRQHQVEVQRIK